MSKHFKEEKFINQFNSKTVFRLIGQAFRHKLLFYGFILFIILTAIFEAKGTYILMLLIDNGILAKNKEIITKNAFNYLLLIAAVAIFVFCFIRMAGILGEKIQYDLKKKMFNHLQNLSFSYYDKTPVGWIISRITSDTRRIAELVSWMLLESTWAVINIITSLYFMMIINYKLAFIILAIIPFLIIAAIKFKKYILKEYRKARSINSKITGAFNENITGVRVVKAFVREDENLRQFGTLTEDMYGASYKAAWLSAMLLPVVQIITSLGIGLVMFYGGRQLRIHNLTIGGMTAFMKYIMFMMWPVMNLTAVYAELQRSIASAERVFSLIDAKPEIINQKNCTGLLKMKGEIELKNVSFYYNKRETVLKNFSLKIKPGEIIALVGPTGGGKTTLINLISRFYQPISGLIMIDGQDYRNYSLESLQSKFGIVLQTPHLFSGNIRENIRYGRLDAADKEVYEASKMAHAHIFIKNLKKGYNEEVGEGGVMLSVGQKQLISIARAILAKPSLIIMDEATSSIDTITESLIQKGMKKSTRNCTSFIVAHRLSTIRHADRILFIDNGKIKEQGTHKELIKLKGHYFNIYTSQFREQKEKDIFN